MWAAAALVVVYYGTNHNTLETFLCYMTLLVRRKKTIYINDYISANAFMPAAKQPLPIIAIAVLHTLIELIVAGWQHQWCCSCLHFWYFGIL